MWKVIEGPRAAKLTHALATQFAEMEPCPHDRPLSETRLEHIARIIAEDRFRAPEWASCFCVETGKTYRMNGKHTSNVLTVTEKLPEVKAIITHYECPTLEDVANLYSTFDSRFSARSAKDIYLVYGMSCPELQGVHGGVIELCASGLAFGIWEFAAQRKPPEQRAELLLKHYDFVQWASSLDLWSGEHRILRRSPVVAAMFKTHNKDKEHADVFWREVMTGTNADNNSASRVLQRWLLSASLQYGGGSGSLKVKSGSHEMMVRCIHGWNAYRRNENTKLIYYASKPTPEVV